MTMYSPSYLSSRVVLYVSSKSLPITSLLAKASVPTCEREVLSNFVGQGVKFSYLSPAYPTLTRNPFLRAEEVQCRPGFEGSALKPGVYKPLPPYEVTLKSALQNLKRMYGNNIGGGAKP